jgi:hypothetical protein
MFSLLHLVLEVHVLPKNADEAMKSVVRVPTGTDTRSCPSGDQKKVPHIFSHILNHKDFQYEWKTAHNDATDLACADVMHTANRYWCRGLLMHANISILKFPTQLKRGEQWVEAALAEMLHLSLADVVTLYMPAGDQSNAPHEPYN